MPCHLCSEMFYIAPCKHPYGRITQADIKIPIRNSILRCHLLDYTIQVYENLHRKCRCKECLVKTMCNHKRVCREYYIVTEEHTHHIMSKLRLILFQELEHIKADNAEDYWSRIEISKWPLLMDYYIKVPKK